MTVSQLKPEIKGDADTRNTYLSKQGLALPIAQVRIAPLDGSNDDGPRIGAIEVRGTSVTGAYLNNPKPEKWTEDGWFKTGDIGSLDELGYLSVLGEKKILLSPAVNGSRPAIWRTPLSSFRGSRAAPSSRAATWCG